MRVDRSCRPVTGPRGAVAAAHPLATKAGLGVLKAGGSAVDAMIAAQAVICVTMPHAAGLGGDMLCLVRPGGGADDAEPAAVNGTGRSASSDRPANPGAGASVTVPGLVDGWVAAHARWGRLPRAEVLADAVTLATEGFAIDAPLHAAVHAQRSRLVDGGAQAWPLMHLAPGELWLQPKLAALLAGIGQIGAEAFYQGAAAEAVVAAVQRTGGTLDAGDLAAHRSEVGAPVTVAFDGARVAVQPPFSQGVLLALALRELEAASQRFPGADPAHLMVEVTEAAFAHRSECGNPASVLAQRLDVEPQRASGRGGPRAYLHTAGVAAADASGMVVSSLVSVFDDFGSGVFVPELGIALNNRSDGFTDGANAPRPGARPVHTLAPMMLNRPGGDWLAMATPGADGQVQTLLQILAALCAGVTLPEAISAPRWRSENAVLLIESDHPQRDTLARLGHRVAVRAAGDDVFGAVVAAGLRDGRPFAAPDWRRSVTAGAT